MCTHTHTYIYTYVRTYIHTYIHTYYICTHTHTHRHNISVTVATLSPFCSIRFAPLMVTKTHARLQTLSQAPNLRSVLQHPHLSINTLSRRTSTAHSIKLPSKDLSGSWRAYSPKMWRHNTRHSPWRIKSASIKWVSVETAAVKSTCPSYNRLCTNCHNKQGCETVISYCDFE